MEKKQYICPEIDVVEVQAEHTIAASTIEVKREYITNREDADGYAKQGDGFHMLWDSHGHLFDDEDNPVQSQRGNIYDPIDDINF